MHDSGSPGGRHAHHGHAHHGGAGHGGPGLHGAGDSERRLLAVLILTGSFTVVEVVGGVVAGSLALLADAAHMFTDTASLALAWLAFRLGRRPPDPRRSYGYHRLEVLAAYTNGVTLLFLALWIAIEAGRRLLAPQPVLGGLMLGVAVAGLAVNLLAFWALHGGDRHNLNMRAAALHVLGDLLGSVAAIAAAGVILTTGWTPVDPLLSLLVAGLIARAGVAVVRDSGHILIQGAPEALDEEEVRAVLRESVPEVADVHGFHAWSLTAERPVVTLHVSVGETDPGSAPLDRVKAVLRERFGIRHATVQLEHRECPDEDCPPGEEESGR